MLNTNLIIGFFSLIITIVVYLSSRDLSMLGGVFINYVLVALGGMSIVEIIIGFMRPEKVAFFESIVERNNIFTGVIIMLIYLVLLPLAGFLPSSCLFIAVLTLYLSDDRTRLKTLLQSFALSFVVVTVFYLLFKVLLQVPLPHGRWFVS